VEHVVDQFPPVEHEGGGVADFAEGMGGYCGASGQQVMIGAAICLGITILVVAAVIVAPVVILTQSSAQTAAPSPSPVRTSPSPSQHSPSPSPSPSPVSQRVYCWGQVLDVSNGLPPTCTPAIVPIGTGPQEFVALVVGAVHLGALLASGEVYMWGYNSYGQLGIGNVNINTGVYTSPTQAVFPTGTVLKALAAGAAFSGALGSDSTLWMWENNLAGQLGINSDTSQALPTAVGTGYTALSLGVLHACALKGTNLFCWGSNSYCSTTDAVVGDKRDETPFLVSSLTNVMEVSCGYDYSVALLSDGTVWAWGIDTSDQLGQTGGNGFAVCAPGQVSLPSAAIKVSVSRTEGCAIVQGNLLYCWGYNSHGELGDGTTVSEATPKKITSLTNVQDISCSGHTATPWLEASYTARAMILSVSCLV